MAARAVAVLIDGVGAFALGVLVGKLTGQTDHGGDTVGFSLHGGPALLWFVLAFGYWIVCERVWGMTIGKRIFSIRVVGDDGGNPGLGSCVGRNLLRVVDGFPYVLPYLVGFVVAKTNGDRRRIGDKLAGTRVVRSG
jgi:uncharacterized RDD family membrane protein YckC